MASRWWEQADDRKRALATAHVKNKQLEFINGGWCMHDEASPLWTAMVDQTTRGHQFLFKHFGVDAAPRGTWQIDPFGHSNTQAWLLGAEAGMESLFWGRMDWQDRTMRYKKEQGTNGFEWVWQGSRSLGKSAQIFAGNLFGHGGGGYSSWFSFDGGGGNPDGGADTDRYHRMMAADLLRDRQEAEQEINRLHERLVASQCVGTEASSPPSAASVLQNSHRAPTLAGGAEDGGGDGMPSVADGLAAAAGSAWPPGEMPMPISVPRRSPAPSAAGGF